MDRKNTTTAGGSLLILLFAAAPALAQDLPWNPTLIAKYESAGGRNLPNFEYDGPYGRHSAEGPCQMLRSTWLEIAPTVDIDIVKFPTAGAAPEHQQWQACFKLFAMRGYDPWSCCNERLRKALALPAPRHRPDTPPHRDPPQTPSSVPAATPDPFLSPGPTPGEIVFATKEAR